MLALFFFGRIRISDIEKGGNKAFDSVKDWLPVQS